MNSDHFRKFRQEKTICLALSGLTAFMGTMKAVGLFATGFFPWYVEIIASIVLLARGVFLTRKISQQNDNYPNYH
jgi:hypothetical protein